MEENSKKMKSGLEKAPHRSLLYALGLTREEMERPLVGVVNAASEVVPGHLHLGKLAEAVKAGVRMAGGTPLEFPAIAVCDGIAMNHEGMRFSLPSREFIADSIEIMARAHAFDALVFIPNCDKCVPGMLMAMMRLNIPSVLVSGGPMLPGTLTPGKQGDLITLFEGVGRVRNGQMSEEELTQWEERACPGCGSCAGMFTANSMNCLAETIGVALPGNGTIPAVHAARVRLAKQAGMRVMDLVKRNIRPRDIVTRGAVENAIAVDMALGCSTNTTLHLPAIFHEAGLDIDLSVFDEVSRKSPNLCKLSPAGHHYMVDLESRGSLLDVEAFSNPFAYTMKITEKNECKERPVDLVETFNYLIGLTVTRQSAISYWLSKPAEHPAYEGAVELVSDISGQYVFRQIEGTLPDGRRALVIWRSVTDDIVASNAALDAYFTTYRNNAENRKYDVIFVNGDSNLENLRGKSEGWTVRMTETEFKNRMFEEA